MNNPGDPLSTTVTWLARHTGFPAHRLESPAELLVCFAALATAEEASPVSNAGIPGRNTAEIAAQRAHAHRRSMVHYKSDNSAKV